MTYLLDENGKIETIFGSSEGIDKGRSKQHAGKIGSQWDSKL